MTPEEKAAFEKQLQELKTNLETATDTKTKAAVEAEIKKLIATLPTQEQVKELQELVEKMQKDAEENQKAIDKLIADQKAAPVNGQVKTFHNYIGEQLTKHKDMLKTNAKSRSFEFEVDEKAVGNMSSAGNLTGSYFVTPQVVPGVILQPYEEVHLRNVIPTGSINSNVLRYVQDRGGEGGPGMVAEGGTKPQMDRDLAILDRTVRKIATYLRVPEEMMEDIPFLQSFLSNVAQQEVMLLEDEQILYGDNTGNNLSGFIENKTDFSGTGLGVEDPNEFDVLRAARTQARLLHRYPSIALVNPADYYKMESTKDSTGNYMLMGGGNGINPGRNVSGLTVIDHTAVEADDFFVIDPRAAQIFDRTGLSIRFYDQDQDNAIKNLVTIVVEKRLVLAVYYTTGIIYGQFSTAIAELESAS